MLKFLTSLFIYVVCVVINLLLGNHVLSSISLHGDLFDFTEEPYQTFPLVMASLKSMFLETLSLMVKSGTITAVLKLVPPLWYNVYLIL